MRTAYYLGASLLALTIAGPAFAQIAAPVAPDDQASQVDDIIVTAAKREQTLQDVPISVSVTSAATLEQAQIRDLIDLQTVVPSLKVVQSAAVGQTNFFIRGFGNGAGNDGIESSVGVFVDGVYRSRTSSALDDLPEVQRIEVLRGPQSTLFGKNVSAGAISIVTARPQFDFGGNAEVSFGNYNSVQAKATVTGPVSDTVAVRLSATSNTRDGVMHNTTTGTDVNDRDRWSVRGDLLWKPNDDLSVRVIADYNKINEICCGTVQLQNGPSSNAIPLLGLGAIGNPATKFDRNLVFDVDPSNELVGKGISAQVDWNAGFANFTSITAYRKQTNESFQDVDFTGADLSYKNQANEISTFTQEFRLTSKGDGPLSWLLGAFYQDESLDTGVDTRFGTEMRAYANALSGGAINTLETLQGRPVGTTYFQAGQGIQDFYKMDQTAYSVFGQADYKVTDRLTLTGGLAFMSDKKEAASNVVLTDLFSQQNFTTFLGGAFRGLNPLQFFYANTTNHAPVNYPNATESGVLKGDKVTYALRAAYDFDLFNVYASYSTGWKAGAYNLSSDSRPPNTSNIGRTADPEDVTVYELGLKANFHGGYFNLAVFDQSIEGFQSNAYTGTGYSLVNAGKQSVKGAEIDAAWRPIEWLQLTGGVTYLDPKYDSFTGAPCASYDTVRCPTAATPSRDLSGQTPANIPKWTYSASALLTHDFGDDFGGYLRVEYDYGSDVRLAENVPPSIATYGRENVNASLGLTYAPQQIEVMLWARNLTNDDSIIAAFPTVAQAESYSGFTNQPRTYGVTLRKRF
jgi:iron complex outermembrane receptor protein